ncbi:MAG TPA: hypothetical protein VG942_15800 [Hyphomonadaceae bacterium]|nr:hypothetical protein [Hyphomonadaceae bacterium]
MSKYWFRKKQLGFGITPASWEGWLITLVYTGLVALSGRFVLAPGRSDTAHVIAFAAVVVTLTILLIVIGYAKTEGGRGGKPDKR